MPKIKPKSSQPTQKSKKRRPPTTPEARESYMVSLAMDLAEQRMLDGTASAQEVTHFLKLGTEKARLENEKIKKENLLLEAKTEDVKSNKTNKELFEQAMKAFGRYHGATEPTEEVIDDEDVF